MKMSLFKKLTKPCPKCKGTGGITIKPVSQAEPKQAPVKCRTCEGRGRVDARGRAARK